VDPCSTWPRASSCSPSPPRLHAAVVLSLIPTIYYPRSADPRPQPSHKKPQATQAGAGAGAAGGWGGAGGAGAGARGQGPLGLVAEPVVAGGWWLVVVQMVPI
jgi:hypothetical protein